MESVQENAFEKNYTNIQMLRDVWRFLSPYKGKVILATVVRACSDGVWLYAAWAFAEMVTFCTRYVPGDSLRPITLLFLGWIVMVLIRIFGQHFARISAFIASDRAALDAQISAMQQLCALDMAWHEHENTGNKVKRIGRGGESIDKLMRMWINTVIEITITFVGSLVVIALTDRWIALVTCVFLSAYSVLSYRTLVATRAAAQEVNAKEEELGGAVFEGMNTIRTLKVLNLSRPFLHRISALSDEVFVKVQRRIVTSQGRKILLNFCSNVFRIIALIVIVIGVLHGTYGVGFLVLFNFYFGRVIDMMGTISETAQEALMAKLGMARMMEVLQTPAYPEGKDAVRNFPKVWEKISVRNLSFSYGGDEILHDISFDLRRGERLGLVGLSGAGKSTLFKLLLKENEEYTGEIFVDDIPLRSIKKSSYYQKATVVLQETEVFNFSLRENVAIANPKKKNEVALKKALDIAHVTSFLHRLPQGIETMIGEKGVKLSGGERQRVGIARAVFKEPEILFLDEATSHLDVESEEKIQESLHVFFKNVTALVIAHRLTTIKEMDRILVLESGRIIESGTFAELYDRKGRFFELWEKQKLG